MLNALKAGVALRSKSRTGGRRWLKWIILGPLLAVLLLQLYFFLRSAGGPSSTPHRPA
jgi:monofunctional biosynthetic peptidoglycan transglycosylase